MSSSDPGLPWEALLRVTRAGSRTILCDPDDRGAVELARRGYRVLVLHSGGYDMAGLRQHLRDSGLSSALMGAHAYRTDEPPNLAPDFYELWVFCAAPGATLLQAAAVTLKKGAPIFWPEGNEPPFGLELLDHPPKGWTGGRLSPGQAS